MAGRLRPRLRVAHRAFQAAIARDVTAVVSGRSTLVIAPHPDDETLGCGGTIALIARSGAPIQVLVVSDGQLGAPPEGVAPAEFAATREAECIEACMRLGIESASVHFLRLPDSDLALHPEAITAAVSEALLRTVPAQVFTPLGQDAHADHRAVASAVDGMLRRELAGIDVFGYPLWFWNRWAWTSQDRTPGQQRIDLLTRPLRMTLSTRWRKVRIGDLAAAKRRALDAHASQVRVLDPAWLEQFFRDDELFLQLSQGSRRR